MKFNITDHFLKLFTNHKEQRDKATEQGKLVSINPKSDEEAYKYIKDLIKNGVPFSEFDWVLDAIIYLYFGGIIHESNEVVFELHQEIANGAFNEKIILKMSELLSYPIRFNSESPTSLNHYVPYYLLQKKMGDFTISCIERARNWVKEHQNLESFIWHEHGHYTWSVWLEGDEAPPHEKPEWRSIIQENEQNYFREKRRRESSIYGGRPNEILTPFKPELQESFSWWSFELGYLLTHKFRAPEFYDNKEYEEVALEIGDRCLKLLPHAKDNLHRVKIFEDYEANERMKDKAFNENRGLAKYVQLLIDTGNLKKALYVCEECIKYGVHDGTKTGFLGRAENIRNKISKQTPKILNKRGTKGVLSDEQILELVEKYLSSSSEDRQLLPAEYGITRSNLYYIVSKNKHRL